MTRASPIEVAFVAFISLQCLVIAAHDWIDVPGWIHGRQVQAVVGRRKLAIATLINVAFPGTAVLFAFRFFNAPKPPFVLNYWAIYTGITVASAFMMWWFPYFFGSSPKQAEDYRMMYAGTHYVLPERKGSRGPNLAHLLFHALFLSTLILSLALRFKAA